MNELELNYEKNKTTQKERYGVLMENYNDGTFHYVEAKRILDSIMSGVAFVGVKDIRINSSGTGIDIELMDGTVFHLIFTKYMLKENYDTINDGTLSVDNARKLNGKDSSFYLDLQNQNYENDELISDNAKDSLDEVVTLLFSLFDEISTLKNVHILDFYGNKDIERSLSDISLNGSQLVTVDKINQLIYLLEQKLALASLETNTNNEAIHAIIKGQYLSTSSDNLISLDKTDSGVVINTFSLSNYITHINDDIDDINLEINSSKTSINNLISGQYINVKDNGGLTITKSATNGVVLSAKSLPLLGIGDKARTITNAQDSSIFGEYTNNGSIGYVKKGFNTPPLFNSGTRIEYYPDKDTNLTYSLLLYDEVEVGNVWKGVGTRNVAGNTFQGWKLISGQTTAYDNATGVGEGAITLLTSDLGHYSKVHVYTNIVGMENTPLIGHTTKDGKTLNSTITCSAQYSLKNLSNIVQGSVSLSITAIKGNTSITIGNFVHTKNTFALLTPNVLIGAFDNTFKIVKILGVA